jgi:hypothetical protein
MFNMSPGTILAGLTLVAIISALIFWVVWLRPRRVQKILNTWAIENDYEILHRRISLLGGPFFFAKSRAEIQYITVRDKVDVIRKGWIKLGSNQLGVLENTAEIRWDEKAKNDS